MKTLVLSTTGHPEANLESARYFIQNKSNIEKITILSSEYMNKEGKNELLTQSIQTICEIKIEIINIPQGYEESNMQAIQELLLSWIKPQPLKNTFIFNVTGGTKLMSIALDRVSMLLGSKRAECFYQSRDQKIVWYQRHNDKIIYPMNSNLNLQ